MTNDLISRSALKEKLQGHISNGTYAAFYVNDAIDNAPTVDLWEMRQEATENALKKAKVLYARPQGEWIDEGQYAEGHSEHAYFCKNCNYEIIEKPNTISENRFCKNCGADMRKGGA